MSDFETVPVGSIEAMRVAAQAIRGQEAYHRRRAGQLQNGWEVIADGLGEIAAELERLVAEKTGLDAVSAFEHRQRPPGGESR